MAKKKKQIRAITEPSLVKLWNNKYDEHWDNA